MYYTFTDSLGATVIVENSGNQTVCIPEDAANSDYQRYLEWVAAGGIPEPWNGA